MNPLTGEIPQVTLREVQDEFGISTRTMREVLAADLLPARKLDGAWHIEREVMVAFVEALNHIPGRRPPEKAPEPTPRREAEFFDSQYGGPPQKLEERRARPKFRSAPYVRPAEPAAQEPPMQDLESPSFFDAPVTELDRQRDRQVRSNFKNFMKEAYGPDGLLIRPGNAPPDLTPSPRPRENRADYRDEFDWH